MRVRARRPQTPDEPHEGPERISVRWLLIVSLSGVAASFAAIASGPAAGIIAAITAAGTLHTITR